ncbi:unnamed protein product [Linum tenue]|uniref:Pectinesterase inhibitor domain-containing protein n=1 Tax=Linum tenue TaxID=586396 RepID=A0AAV0I382_9ROSI|nr:unnamed protein product [Linum tenue]
MAVLLISTLLLLISSSSNHWVCSSSYVEDACSVTRYQDLCIRSLSSFSRTAKSSPSKWARAGVSVTLSESKNTTQFLVRMLQDKEFSGPGTNRNRIALSDCVECFREAVDELHRSLALLRNLLDGAADFEAQMADLTTWVGAALTDQDTCLDGFRDREQSSMKMVRRRVRRVGYIMSNALALITRLASAGLA